MSSESLLPLPDLPEPDGFGCELRPQRDTVRVLMTGALDMASVPGLDAQLRELRDAGFGKLILDLSRLDFMDSAGLRLMLKWATEAREGEIAIQLVAGPPAVQRVFEVTGTAELLPFIAGVPDR